MEASCAVQSTSMDIYAKTCISTGDGRQTVIYSIVARAPTTLMVVAKTSARLNGRREGEGEEPRVSTEKL